MKSIGNFKTFNSIASIASPAISTTSAISSFDESEEASTSTPPDPLLTLIAEQHLIRGYWKNSAKAILESFFKGGKIYDKTVEYELAKSTDDEHAYLTLVALHVLEEKFADRSTEWSLIADKGKDYLKKNGVSNPKLLLKAFTELEFK